jgi:dTDP-4-dehydrorhamnose reductase
MKKLFGIGISGLVGTRIAEVLKNQYLFENLSLDTGVDITNPASLDVIRKDTEHSEVLHLAALADVDGCEKQKEQGKASLAYKINVEGTRNVVAACKEAGKKIIYISTDFVFDGENTPSGGYTETDTPHPLNWYAQTKYTGEEIVRNAGIPFCIMRIAYPFSNVFFELKPNFVHVIMHRLAKGEIVTAVTDHIMTPTYLDDIALALGKLLETDATGIFHVVGSQFITPYDAAVLIAKQFGYDTSLVRKTTREQYFAHRAKRPFNLSMNNDKIKKLGVSPRTFEEGLKEL